MLKPIAIFIAFITVIIVIFYRWQDPYHDAYFHAYNNNVYQMLASVVSISPSFYIDTLPVTNQAEYAAFSTPTTVSQFIQSPTAIPARGINHLCSIRDARHHNTLLHWASKSMALDVMQFLLDIGCSPNTANVQGSTPLHWAATNTALNPKEFIEYEIHRNMTQSSDVIELGPNMESPIPYQFTPLPENPAIELLVKYGASVNVQNSSKETPLHFAVSWVSVPSVYSLVKAKADYTTLNQHKNTPLHQIPKDCNESQQCWKIVTILVTAGADLHLANKYGRKPVDYLDFNIIPPLLSSADQQLFESFRASNQQPTPPSSSPSSSPPSPSPSPSSPSSSPPTLDSDQVVDSDGGSKDDHNDNSTVPDIQPKRKPRGKRIRDEL